MRLYVGIDLDANNNYLAIIDKKGKRIDRKELAKSGFGGSTPALFI